MAVEPGHSTAQEAHCGRPLLVSQHLDVGQQSGVAAVASLLHRHSGQQDITLGVPVAGRCNSLSESLIGSFVDLLLIRIDLSGEPTPMKLLERVRKASLNAYDHQEFPFVMLEQRLWPLHRPHTYVPVVVNLVDLPWKPSLRRVAVNRLPSPSLRARYELEFRFRHLSGGSLQAKIIYATSRFSEDGIRALFDEFKYVLSASLR
ncbi:MAG: condensation domain-containing protein [Prochlorococcaceae cyanobacterium]